MDSGADLMSYRLREMYAAQHDSEDESYDAASLVSAALPGRVVLQIHQKGHQGLALNHTMMCIFGLTTHL